MKTHLFRLVASFLLTALLTACPETYVPDHFGTAAADLKAADWNGDWHPADEPKEAFTFRVSDAAPGVIELLEAKPKDAKKPERITLALRETGVKSDEKLQFVILKDTTKAGPGSLYLIRPSDDGVMLLWSIDSAAVTAAIKAGELQGTVAADKDGPHNTLAADPSNYPKLLAPKFWKWTEPSVMLRSK